MVNAIRKLIHIEEEQVIGFEWKSPQVLVEMDTVARVPEELEIVWEGDSFVQKLDY